VVLMTVEPLHVSTCGNSLAILLHCYTLHSRMQQRLFSARIQPLQELRAQLDTSTSTATPQLLNILPCTDKNHNDDDPGPLLLDLVGMHLKQDNHRPKVLTLRHVQMAAHLIACAKLHAR
jgi:hypothetical protein